MRGKRKIALILTALLITAGSTGCGENQIPDLSEDEMRAVGEYVAVTMMKYDINHRSRLMELTDTALGGQGEGTGQEIIEEETGMPPVDDTPVVDATGSEEAAAPVYSLEEVIGLPAGVEVVFQQQEVCDNYPEGGEYFSLNASEGKKLLVLHFSLSNSGSEDQSVDMLSSGAVLNITVNEEYRRRALTTMLLEDLATYGGIVPAGGSVETVLVIEVDGDIAENISAIHIQAKNEEKTAEMQVF